MESKSDSKGEVACPSSLGRAIKRERKKDSLPIQIPWCDTHFVQFKEEKLIQLGLFLSGEKQKFRSVTKILAADGLRSHVTITLRDTITL